MATTKVHSQIPSGWPAPSPDRKRKQRSLESPDVEFPRGHTSASRSSGFRSASPTRATLLSPEAVHDMRYNSTHSSASGSATLGSGSSRGIPGEENLTLRRREANRLAAQRFRSRKKGYQDSLEERIRILEDEKDTIARRLDQTHHHPPQDERFYRPTDTYRRPSRSPDRPADADVRVASLESANRRLQDELRGVMEDNDRLRDEVERWRKWERDMREPRREEYPRPTPTLPPLEFGPMAPPSYSSAAYPGSYTNHPQPPLERGRSYTGPVGGMRPSSPGPRLPPLRMPTGPPHSSPFDRPMLPRTESTERFNPGRPPKTSPPMS